MMEETVQMTFDPSIFGFTIETDSSRRLSKDVPYLLQSKKGQKRTYWALSLDEETYKAAFRLFGVRCNVALNPDTGALVIYKGNSRVMSGALSNNSVKGKRGMIAISPLAKTLKELWGDSFKRLYLKPSIWAAGQAILLEPTGDTD